MRKTVKIEALQTVHGDFAEVQKRLLLDDSQRLMRACRDGVMSLWDLPKDVGRVEFYFSDKKPKSHNQAVQFSLHHDGYYQITLKELMTFPSRVFWRIIPNDVEVHLMKRWSNKRPRFIYVWVKY